MSETPFGAQQPPLSEEDKLRFEQDLPQWLAGHLPPEQAQWMQQMQLRHPDLAEQADWLLDARTVLRDEVATEDTTEAWALLSHRLMEAPALAPTNGVSAETKTEAHRQAGAESRGPRWLKWLQIHPGWANAAAAAAVVLIVGQAGWIVSQSDSQASTADWRSLDLDDLQAAPSSMTRIQLQLKPGTSSAEMAAAQAAIADAAMNSDVSWQAQPQGAWVLRVVPAVKDEPALLARLNKLPFIVQAQAQTPTSTQSQR